MPQTAALHRGNLLSIEFVSTLAYINHPGKELLWSHLIYQRFRGSFDDFDNPLHLFKEMGLSTELHPMIGKVAGDYELVRIIADGPFSWLALGRARESGTTRAIKVAKPSGQAGFNKAEAIFPTQALRFTTGGIAEIAPDPEQLLLFQHRTLSGVSDSNVIKPGRLDTKGPFWHYDMEFVEGITLRELSRTQRVSLGLGIELCSTLIRVAPQMPCHGDLKPDNILFRSEGIILIDPGYFGPIDAEPENLEFAAVTTSAYYPFLSCDDLLACGIVFWELAMGEHPLDGSGIPTAGIEVGDGLLALIEQRENIGQYMLSPLQNLRAPRKVHPEFSPEYEEFLLRSLGLCQNKRGVIDTGKGFESFKEMLERLSWLKKNGQEKF